MVIGDSDLGVFFADFSVSVVFQGQTAKGNFDTPADMFDAGGGMSAMEQQRYCIALPFNAFAPVPKSKDSITVDSVAYTVKARKYSEDGKIMTLELAK
jgi:hypothetical protein